MPPDPPDGGPVPLAPLRDDARRTLFNLLDASPGRKTLVLDPALSTWLGLFADVPSLKEHGVDHLTLLARADAACGAAPPLPPPPPGAGPVIFIARPSPSTAAAIAAAVKAGVASAAGARREYRALFPPRAGSTVRAALASAGALGSVAVVDLPIHYVPADADVLSLEDGDAPARHARGHPGPAHATAAALAALQARLGAPAVVRAAGPAALAVADALAAGRRAAGVDAPPPGGGAVTEWIIIDRAVDWVSPLLTQLTYEGMVRETVAVVGGAAVVEGGGGVGGDAATPSTTRVPLAPSDPTFRDLRDLSFAAAGPALGARARAIQAGYGAAKGRDAPLTELKAFAASLKTLPSIQRHVALAEAAGAAASAPEFRARVGAEQGLLAGARDAGDVAAAAAEDALARGAPRAVPAALRLLALACATGAPPGRARLERATRELAASAGPEVVATLCGLDAAGLLTADPAAAKPPFPALRRHLRLLADAGDPASPTDAAYVFAGFAPVAARLVEAAAAPGGWAASPGAADALRAVGGGRETAWRVDDGGRPVESPWTPSTARRPPSSSPVTTLVVFVGGAVAAELAALRFVGGRPGAASRYVVATSAVVTGDDVVASFAPREVADLAAAVAGSAPV